jgi:hypothetical protein
MANRKDDARATERTRTVEDFIKAGKYETFKDKNGDWKRGSARHLQKMYPKLGTLEQFRHTIRYLTKTNGKTPISVNEFPFFDGKKRDLDQYKTDVITTNKKEANFHWKKVLPHLKGLQQVYKDGKDSQDFAIWKIKANQITIVVLGDLHTGSWATDYDLFCEITEELINTPNLYVILVGDLLQMSIKLRGVLEVSDNALPPKWQIKFLESWLMDVKHKVICSTWDNHSVMREENASGFSQYANIFSRHVIYHDNIGHIDIQVNDQIYKIAVAHFFRGRTMLNPVHGQMRYMRMTSNDREIAIAGDSHVPGIMMYEEGGHPRTAINCGSIQNSGYGKRFFSLLNSPIFPCFKLSGVSHTITPYWSVKESLL